jgi:hypothetical protein
MRVDDLIEELKRLNSSAEVYFYDEREGKFIEIVEFEKDECGDAILS